MSIVGDCKTGATGVSGAAYTALMADGDNGMVAAVGTSGSPQRRLVGAQIEALVGALLGVGIIGSVTILGGSNSATITHAAITLTSLILSIIEGTADDVTLTQIVRYSIPSAGSAIVYGNAVATANVIVAYMVVN